MSNVRKPAALGPQKLALAAALLLLLEACAAPAPSPPRPTPKQEPAPPPAAAAPALGGRLLADAQEYPWSALGRVNLAGQGFCTGVLIGPRQVLTQARCLYAEREGRWFKPFELHVVAAYQRDSFLADSKVADFAAAPGFNPQAGSSLANLASNWALITLQEPIGQRTGWLGLQWDSAGLQAASRAGTAAYLRAGYRYDRPHAVSLHFGCSEAADSAARLCQATPAELSLPPFVITDGELRVLADFYATTPSQGSALARLSGAAISGGRLGTAQPPSRDGLAGRQPTATAAQLLAALGYDIAGGDIGGAAAAFRRDNGLPAGEAIDLPLLAALLNAAWRSGR
jgi:protease YdgD